MTWEIRVGDALEQLAEMPAESVHCVVTSPPYFGLRDYGTGAWEGGDAECDHLQKVGGTAASTLGTESGGNAMSDEARRRATERSFVPYADECKRCGARRVDRQVGLEATPDAYVARLVEVFRELRRVLRADGTVWLNIGDSYASGNSGERMVGINQRVLDRPGYVATQGAGDRTRRPLPLDGYKPKDLLGIPWMLAFALRADGWYLRSDVIWAKPNPMPESVTDRPTSAHEHVFLLAKSERYFYDSDAIREAAVTIPQRRLTGRVAAGGHNPAAQGGTATHRNKRNVWEIATQAYTDAHFAVFPPKLVEPCVLAGSSPKCCGACGAPWRRVTDRETSLEGNSARAGRAADEIAAGGKWTPEHLNGNANLKAGPVVDVRTTGWESTCEHQDDTGRAMVLDPFVGSGTVGVVCEWLGRDFVGIELNPEYAEMARARIASEGPLGRRAYRPQPRDDDQMALL